MGSKKQNWSARLQRGYTSLLFFICLYQRAKQNAISSRLMEELNQIPLADLAKELSSFIRSVLAILPINSVVVIPGLRQGSNFLTTKQTKVCFFSFARFDYSHFFQSWMLQRLDPSHVSQSACDSQSDHGDRWALQKISLNDGPSARSSSWSSEAGNSRRRNWSKVPRRKRQFCSEHNVTAASWTDQVWSSSQHHPRPCRN